MWAGTPMPTSTSASGVERLVAANADEKKPTSVMATWMAARNSPESPETLLGLVLENHLLGGGESHLRHGEVAVDKGEQERDCDRECYVHAPLRDLLGRVS